MQHDVQVVDVCMLLYYTIFVGFFFFMNPHKDFFLHSDNQTVTLLQDSDEHRKYSMLCACRRQRRQRGIAVFLHTGQSPFSHRKVFLPQLTAETWHRRPLDLKYILLHSNRDRRNTHEEHLKALWVDASSFIFFLVITSRSAAKLSILPFIVSKYDLFITTQFQTWVFTTVSIQVQYIEHRDGQSYHRTYLCVAKKNSHHSNLVYLYNDNQKDRRRWCDKSIYERYRSQWTKCQCCCGDSGDVYTVNTIGWNVLIADLIGWRSIMCGWCPCLTKKYFIFKFFSNVIPAWRLCVFFIYWIFFFKCQPLPCHWGFGSHITQQPCLLLSLEVHGGIRCVPVMVQHCLNSSDSKTTAAVPPGVSICRREKRWVLR